jgi:O-antigen ligase
MANGAKQQRVCRSMAAGISGMLCLVIIAADQSTTVQAIGIGTVIAALVDPIWGVLALGAFSLITPSVLPPLMEIGELSLRMQDVAFAAVVSSMIARWSSLGRREVPLAVDGVFLLLAIFVGYIGFTLIEVHLVMPERLATAAASLLRLAQYALLAPLVFLAISSRTGVERFVRGLIVLGIVVVVVVAVQVIGTDWLNQRTRPDAFVGNSSLGLIAALLCLIGVTALAERWTGRAIAIMAGGAGVFGLILAKSASALFAAGITVILYMLWQRRKRDLLTPVFLMVAGLAGIVATVEMIQLLRPSDFRGLLNLSGGSFVHRILVAAGGVLLIWKSPLVGLGWQMSLAPEILSAPDVDATLKHWFPLVPTHYFPSANPSSMHNLYLQLVVDLGLIGLTLAVILGRSVGGVVQQAAAVPDHKPLAHLFGYSLVLLLFWWNAAALWGGQIESFLVFTFIGMVSVLAFDREKTQERFPRSAPE